MLYAQLFRARLEFSRLQIHKHGDKNYQALEYHLEIARHAEHIERILYQTERQYSKHSAKNASNSSIHAHTAYYDSRYGI